MHLVDTEPTVDVDAFHYSKEIKSNFLSLLDLIQGLMVELHAKCFYVLLTAHYTSALVK